MKHLMGWVTYIYTSKCAHIKKESIADEIDYGQVIFLTVIYQACHIITIEVWLRLLDLGRFVANGLEQIYNSIKKIQNS